MSDEGEKTCPLCAEEMDLTDQQLKPCKCGYEICVWCWHHIMDMAEKDDTEGRCPACRTPYNKEKIVGTASKCERLVADMNVDKKQKSQKGKTKTSEGRKQLSSVRVIQRNLVYIVGLPLNLADEDLLQRKDYFGQYGRVLKVSISRTAAGLIQQSANNTCSVYITYSKEEEAVRSIQSVHGFVLEGRPLRACFGTTKYCHAWLRSMPCTNPECLYLHEFGSQEDSFTKDEIISAYTRVQQITGATNDVQRRSGNLLPPPADDYCNNDTSSCGKPISKNTTNVPANGTRGSPPNSSSGRSVALPAAASWGTRASNCQPLTANVASFKGSSKQKADTCSTTPSFSTAVVSPSHGNEIVKKHVESQTFKEEGEPEHQESMKQLTTASTKEKNKSIHLSSNHVQEKDMTVTDERMIHNISSDISLMSIDRKHGLKLSDNGQFTEPLASNKEEKAAKATKDVSDSVLSSQNKVAEIAVNEIEEDLLSFNNQRLSDPEISTHTSYVQNLTQSSPHSNYTMGCSPQQAYVSVNGSLDTSFANQKLEKGSILQTSRIPVVNGYSSNLSGSSPFSSSNGYSCFIGAEGDRKRMGIYEEAAAAAKGDSVLDLGENSIISNILSMDFDPWNDSLTSPQNLAKLLGENDKLQGSLGASSSRKAQSSNQSRFSFAREDEHGYQGSKATPTLSDFGPCFDHQNFNSDLVSSRDIYLDKLNSNNGFSSFSFQESDFSTTHSPMYPNKISGSRSQISAPPGFSGPSRAPPPGFTSHERMEETFDNLSGNHMFDTSSLSRKAHLASPPVNNGSIGDVVFMDPAILAVGGRVPSGLNSTSLDMRSNFPTQMSSFENDNRLQLLMQRSFSPQQNHRYTEINDSFPHRSDAYGIIPSRIPYQQANFQQPRSSMMSNGHWDGWNEVQSGNDVAMAELLRNERLGLNKYNNYSGYEDTKFRISNSNSGDLYSRTF